MEITEIWEGFGYFLQTNSTHCWTQLIIAAHNCHKGVILYLLAAIMAGFLPIANTEMKDTINDQLEWLYSNGVCAYETELPDGRKPKILWRCSVRLSDWRAPSVDSIDFSTMILGYATNFLPMNFYSTYVAWNINLYFQYSLCNFLR